MSHFLRNQKFPFLSVLLFLFGINTAVHAQVNQLKTSESKEGFITGTFDYSSGGTNFSGYNLTEQQSYTMGTFFTSNHNTDIGLSYILLSNSDTSLTTSTHNFLISIYRNIELNEQLYLGLGADNYLYDKNMSVLNKPYFSSLHTDISWWKEYFSASVQTNLNVGNAVDYGLTITASPMYTYYSKKSKKFNGISLSANASIEFGSRNYIKKSYEYILETDPSNAIYYFENSEELINQKNTLLAAGLLNEYPNINRWLDSDNYSALAKLIIKEYAENNTPLIYTSLINELENQENYSLSMNYIYLTFPLIVYFEKLFVSVSYSMYFPQYNSTLYPADKSNFIEAGIMYQLPIHY